MTIEKRNVWVIKDSKGNFATSIREFENGVMAYISFKTFSMECRCYTNLLSATNKVCAMRSKGMTVGIGETFSLEYVCPG